MYSVMFEIIYAPIISPLLNSFESHHLARNRCLFFILLLFYRRFLIVQSNKINQCATLRCFQCMTLCLDWQKGLERFCFKFFPVFLNGFETQMVASACSEPVYGCSFFIPFQNKIRTSKNWFGFFGFTSVLFFLICKSAKIFFFFCASVFPFFVPF